MKRVRVGSRGSALALWQAEYVAQKLRESGGVAAEIVVIRTAGDRAPYAPIPTIGLKGVFIKEIEDALREGHVDLAVHSLKDVPTETAPDFEFPAVLERHDPRDCLVATKGQTLAELPSGARIGSSSLRRQAQLRNRRPDLQFIELRGNVDTRLRKLDAGACDAVVLAVAGMERLGLRERITEIFEPELCLPAVGQGAIVVEARAGDATMRDLVRALDHPATRAAVTAERAVLARLQGGCQVPVGAWGRLEGEVLKLDAGVFSLDGAESLRFSTSGPASDPPGIGHRLAEVMLTRGAGRLLELTGRAADGV